jgi:hypothetical protein
MLSRGIGWGRSRAGHKAQALLTSSWQLTMVPADTFSDTTNSIRRTKLSSIQKYSARPTVSSAPLSSVRNLKTSLNEDVWGVEVGLHKFLSSALDCDGWSALSVCRITAGKQPSAPTGGGGGDAVAGTEPRSSSPQPVTALTDHSSHRMRKHRSDTALSETVWEFTVRINY